MKWCQKGHRIINTKNEVTADGSHGYMVAVMGQVDCDQAELHRQLESKIRETVSKKYLEENDYSWGPKYSIGKSHDADGLRGIPV